jgi:hypothetical protein
MLRISSIQLNKASAYRRAARWTCCGVSPVCHSYSSSMSPLKPSGGIGTLQSLLRPYGGLKCA